MRGLDAEERAVLEKMPEVGVGYVPGGWVNNNGAQLDDAMWAVVLRLIQRGAAIRVPSFSGKAGCSVRRTPLGTLALRMCVEIKKP